MDDITDSTDMSLSKLREMVKDREAWGTAVQGIAELDSEFIQTLKRKKLLREGS